MLNNIDLIFCSVFKKYFFEKNHNWFDKNNY